jgi:hypothetical protein
MTKLLPQDISNMRNVTNYWRLCLAELDNGEDDGQVASHMVGVAASKYQQDWGNGRTAHPAYQIVFELAASLELPVNITDWRHERWECIRALVSVLEHEYLN